MENNYQTYEAWECEDKSISFGTEESIKEQHQFEGSKPIKKLYEFKAATPEEACSIHFLRMGHPPYKPMGDSELCPQCQSTHYYPEGSGVCPYCGKI